MYNLIAYVTYTFLMVVVIIYIGHYLFKYGQVFIDRCVDSDLELSLTINRVLLTGFYLLNLGAAVYAISTWTSLSNLSDVCISLIYYLSRLIMALGILHYLNILILQFVFKSSKI